MTGMHSRTSTPDIEFEKRRQRVEEALMRAPREYVRRKLNLLPSEMDDYAGPEETPEEGNPVSGY